MSLISEHILGINNKKKNVDFDILVEQKKSMMRSGTEKVNSQVNTRQVRRSPFEERVNESFAKLSAKSNKTNIEVKQLDEIKKIIDLFGKMQWGSGEHLTPICSHVNRILSYTVQSNKVHQVLKTSLESNLLQKIPTTKAINLKEIAIILSPVLFLELFLSDQKFRTKQYDYLGMTSKHAILTLSFIYHLNKLNNESKAFEYTFKQNSAVLTEEQKSGIVIINNKIIDTQTLKNNIGRYISIFMTSSPIKKLKDKTDLQTSLEIFGFSTLPDEKKLKDQYKYLVKNRHPDKAEAYQLPSAIKKQIHENFATIQQAYDILKNKRKG